VIETQAWNKKDFKSKWKTSRI